MILPWIFGVTFGLIVGVGIMDKEQKPECIVNQIGQCAELGGDHGK